jgi:hypothetical protein
MQDKPLLTLPGQSSAALKAGIEGVGMSLGAESHATMQLSAEPVEQYEPVKSPRLQSNEEDLVRCQDSLGRIFITDMLFGELGMHGSSSIDNIRSSHVE